MGPCPAKFKSSVGKYVGLNITIMLHTYVYVLKA